MRKLFLLPLMLAGLLLSACASDSFVKSAYTLGQSYSAAQKGAITYMEVANPSQESRLKIKAANDRAAPVVKDVLKCAGQMAAGEGDSDPAAAALGLSETEALEAKCEGYLGEALASLEALRSAMKGD